MIKFSSPHGVIFSLIKQKITIATKKEFPSPVGVMFSLILKNEKVLSAKKFKNVSVSSRSYILSYFNSIPTIQPLFKVSVSSWSYILSYINLSFQVEIIHHKMLPSPLGVIFSLIRISNNRSSNL